jgi:hypothetical protein
VNVYVETNFVLELAFQQEQFATVTLEIGTLLILLFRQPLVKTDRAEQVAVN